MLIKQTDGILPSEITSESTYLNRRNLIKTSASLSIAGALGGASSQALAGFFSDDPKEKKYAKLKHQSVKRDTSTGFYTNEDPAPFEDASSHNNFYEFGTGKSDPASYAHALETDPWSITVEGEAKKTGKFNLEDILKQQNLEERIYRLRCVEAWSMVIPWVGFPLAKLLKQFEPTGKAKYVSFETLVRPDQMRGQRSRFGTIDWPYIEGLRIDEAMHPLAFMAVGMYGNELPNQNGAPIRLVLPWKYGFKSIKSIVKIRFSETMPLTSWNRSAPQEYGFFANVNPAVDHPRWSQKQERRLPSTLFSTNRIATKPFNGYADQVASLYSNMDLKRYF